MSGAHPIVAMRKLDALRHALGETILSALLEPAVVEILVNPDGRFVLDRSGRGRADTGEIIAAEARERVVRLIADYVGEPRSPGTTRACPASCRSPGNGSRDSCRPSRPVRPSPSPSAPRGSGAWMTMCATR